MSINSSGKKLEGFFTGKGFYIVLFLCATVIGVSAWMMAAGNETMDEAKISAGMDNSRIETVIITPDVKREAAAAAVPAQIEEAAAEAAETVEVWLGDESAESAEVFYIWPVQGGVERSHDLENLSYDVTLRDWRTHEGIDIEAPIGAAVSASRAGTVESIENDDFYGTVVTVNHGDGSCAVYANLAELPAVSVDDYVESGDIIGSVGTTALCEIGQGTHLHFAMYVDGASVDPMNYLPA